MKRVLLIGLFAGLAWAGCGEPSKYCAISAPPTVDPQAGLLQYAGEPIRWLTQAFWWLMVWR